jgi:uncharacterized protein YraI
MEALSRTSQSFVSCPYVRAKKPCELFMSEYLTKALFILIIAIVATPVAAQEEPNGYPITDVNLRAGPGTEYPVLLTVPTDAPITILGCLEDYTWCDTTFEDRRGWMRSIYLAGYYDGEYYLLSDYAPDLGYQIVTFDVAAYWDSYYQGEPFYNGQYRVSEARGADWVDDGVFYDRLSPYGSWTWTQGQYVWVPAGVDYGWRPYTRGRWIYTDYGWTWVSDEPFGWATYHYGRWGFSNRIGWFWVPGNRWGPAWVSWRQSDDYLAWAPLPPVYDRGGLSINISFGSIPSYYWSVVPSVYFLSDNLPRYYVRDRARWRRAYDRTRPIGHTTIVNNTVVNNVINQTYVERHTKTNVVERKVVRTREWDRTGKVRDNAYEVYRPGLREGRGRQAPDKPRNIEDVAKLSKTKDLAKGKETTVDLLAPPEVRDAIEKRRGGRARGEQAGAGELGRGENGSRKFDRHLPKGKDAEGPPRSGKKAKREPVPAHVLGKARGGLDGRPAGESGRREHAISVPDGKKGPLSARPAVDKKAGGGPKEPQRERKASPNGQPPAGLEGQRPSERKPAPKMGRPNEKAKSDDRNVAPQARSRQEGPLGAPKTSPRTKKATSNDQNAAPQARSRQEGLSGGPKTSPQTKKAKSNDQSSPPSMEAKPKPQAKKPAAKPKTTPKPQATKPAAKPKTTPKPQATKPAAKPKTTPKPQAKKSAAKPKAAPKPQAKKSGPKPKAAPKPQAKRSAPKSKATLKRQATKPAAKPKATPKRQATKPAAKPKAAPKPQAKKSGPKPKAAPKPQAKKSAAKPKAAPKPQAKKAAAKPEAATKKRTASKGNKKKKN